MPVTIGFNHVATLTTDMELTVRFSTSRRSTPSAPFEVAKRDDHRG